METNFEGTNTYKNCEWYGCSDSCPSSKILITQRTKIYSITEEGNDSVCSSGTNKLCCDPPNGANSSPVDPKDLFTYPDEDDVSYYYNVQATSNEDSTSDDSKDPFAFVMIDGDTSAYDESLVDQWTFLTDEQELSKQDLKHHKREMHQSLCQRIKLQFFVRRCEVYELTVDYDLASAATEAKGDVNFRVDYTNLLEYWNEITDSPGSKRKRWFGAYDDWLKKMTTIVKDETSYLPLDYEENIKLFHAHANCPKTNIDATFDIDANIKLALNCQYGYYFEGSILPTPTLISAYGYFSIEPVAARSLCSPTQVSWNSSVQGLISIGPELALTSQLSASLQVSGELNAGVSLEWDRTEVYFPQDAAGEKASIAPKDLQSDNDQVYSFEPTFDASLTAQGNLASGITNTIKLGVNATASVSGDGSTSAGFCYWADFVYSIFIQANASLIDGAAYWGDKYDVVSPSNPLPLVEETCIKYASSDPLTKRDNVEALVADSTGSGCFGGLIACNTVNDDTDSSGNMICPYACEGTSCTILDTSSSLSRRQAVTGQCMHYPAMFYNCEWFPNKDIPNLDTSTNGNMRYYSSLVNSAAEGGTGASTSCTPWEQQQYQSSITSMIPILHDKTNNNLPWSTEPWTGQLPRQYTVNLFDSTSNPTGTFLGTYGGYLAGNQNLIRARIAGGVNTFGTNSIYYLTATSHNALCHIDDGFNLRSTAMGVQYIKLIVCNVVYGDSLGTDLKKRDGEDDDDYTGRPEMHPRFWQVQELRVPKDWQNHVVLTRRGDSESFARGLAHGSGASDGLKWDDTDSHALHLLDENHQPVQSSTLATRAQGQTIPESEGESDVDLSASASWRKHYGEHLRRHGHGHH
ncbi:hypothetical protein N7507_001314 [Penicillium longicatenatum]|nr:hypothetical protein N7507_001314 [Penicillium longicatenatum]